MPPLLSVFSTLSASPPLSRPLLSLSLRSVVLCSSATSAVVVVGIEVVVFGLALELVADLVVLCSSCGSSVAAVAVVVRALARPLAGL